MLNSYYQDQVESAPQSIPAQGTTVGDLLPDALSVPSIIVGETDPETDADNTVFDWVLHEGTPPSIEQRLQAIESEVEQMYRNAYETPDTTLQEVPPEVFQNSSHSSDTMAFVIPIMILISTIMIFRAFWNSRFRTLVGTAITSTIVTSIAALGCLYQIGAIVAPILGIIFLLP